LALATWRAPAVRAQSTLLVDIRNLTPQEQRSAAFVLPLPQVLHLRLAAGRYVLHYRTDGSHAYRDWNGDPPDDPEGWGIAVLRIP